MPASDSSCGLSAASHPRHGAWAGYSSFSTALGPQRQEPHVLEHEQSIDNQ